MAESIGGDDTAFVERPQNQKGTSALALRVAGATLADIVRVIGFASEDEAVRAIDKALKAELRSDPRQRDKMRGLANQRLERLLRSVWAKAVDPNSSEHLAAVGKAKELIDRHIRLYGLDAPSEMVVHNPDSSEIEAWVMSVLAKGGQEVEEDDVLEAEVVDEDDGPALMGA